MSLVSRVLEETGIRTLKNASRDVHLLCILRFIRMMGYGQVTLILVSFFTLLGYEQDKTGIFMTSTLLGDVIMSLILTMIADKIGRRKILCLGAGLMCASGIVFAYAENYWILLLAAVVGVISPSGREIGPFRAIEESTLAHLSELNDRSDIYAWYTLLGKAGAAFGILSCGFIVQSLQHTYLWTDLAAYKTIFLLYGIIGAVKFGVSLSLSSATESIVNTVYHSTPNADTENTASSSASTSVRRAHESHNDSGNSESIPMQNFSRKSEDWDDSDTREVLEEMDVFITQKKRPVYLRFLNYLPKISRRSHKILFQLCILFAIDSFASGMASQSWMVYYFGDRFQMQEDYLGTLFFITNLVSGLSSLVAASMSRRLGPIITMVVTHLPSSIILAILGFPRRADVAVALLIIQHCINSMDVAPRQAFVSAIVTQEERTSVMGFINVIKTLAQAGGPYVMGLLASKLLMPIGFLIAGSCKVSYDIAILVFFVGVQLHNS
ncbi:major facilitator superfamily domain-containing protein [Dipodascopsis uninucleata]